MRVVPHVFAAGIGNALSQYQAGICNANFIPAWMCGTVGSSGADEAKLILGKVTSFILAIAAGIGVCMFIYACIQMVLSRGQEDKAASAKRMAIIALIGVFLMLSVEPLIHALKNIFTTIAPH